MAISEDARKSVIFLGYQVGSSASCEIKPVGTAFLVDYRDSSGHGTYLVTAKHISTKLQEDLPFALRLNKKNGGASVIEIDNQDDIDWHYHSDDTVDLAVAEFEAPRWADVMYVSNDLFLHGEEIEELNVGAGDPAFIVGLFHKLHGTERNLPVVYTGHIASLPGDEKIPVENAEVEGYLVQANTISGCSGSPVFTGRVINTPINVQKSPVLRDWARKSARLLGVWQSSWKVKGSEIVSIKTDGDDVDFEKLAPLGMGVVVPAVKLLEILNMSKLSKSREAAGRSKARENASTNDSLPISSEDKHRDRVLGQMLKTPPTSQKSKQR